MIKSFASRDTETIWLGYQVKSIHPDIQLKARKKLQILDAAVNLLDLKIPPSNRLEKLKGDLSGQYSIRVDQQWRLIFIWENGHALNVKLIDYH